MSTFLLGDSKMKQYQITRKGSNVSIATLPKKTTFLRALAEADRLAARENEKFCVKEVETVYTTK